MIAYQYADTGLSNGIDRAWSHLDQASGFFCLFVFQTPGIRAHTGARATMCVFMTRTSVRMMVIRCGSEGIRVSINTRGGIFLMHAADDAVSLSLSFSNLVSTCTASAT